MTAQQLQPGDGSYYMSLDSRLQTLRALNAEWWADFEAAYIEYGPGAADETGLAGQWADLFRKVMKLKRFMWSGESPEYLKREGAEEILRDLAGHCFLALEMLERDMVGGRQSQTSQPLLPY